MKTTTTMNDAQQKEVTKEMIDLVFEQVEMFLGQSQAAALAVLAADIKAGIEEEHVKEDPMLFYLFEKMEQVALKSIQENDGKVVYWIGLAAKQINPLLINNN